ARNRAIDRLRANSVRLRAVESAPPPPAVESPESRAAASEERQAVARALGGLPEGQRGVIEQAYFLGLTQSERAEREQLPAGHVQDGDWYRHDRSSTAAFAVDAAMTDSTDAVVFDEIVELALAQAAAADAPAPSADLKARLMRRVHDATEPVGFAFHWTADDR